MTTGIFNLSEWSTEIIPVGCLEELSKVPSDTGTGPELG